MEYPLPQFLSIKPKVAGPFNFRQLAYIVGGALISVIFYFTMPVVTFLIIATPIMGLSLVLAFGKIKGFPIPTIMMRSFFFVFASKKYIWTKVETPAISMPKAKKQEIEKVKDLTTTLKVTEKSRLKDIGKLIEIHPK
jgi:hypothetical protein